MMSVIFAPILSLLSIFNFLAQNNFAQEEAYCFASYAPHGAFWQDLCYQTQQDCDEVLKEQLDQDIPANTEKCYLLEYTDAYCVSVPSGYFRATDDFEIVEPIYANVCTKKYKDCTKYERFAIDEGTCQKSKVKTREGEGSYLSTEKELKGIWERNSKLFRPTPFIKPMECANYAPIPNQAAAFEALRLDWNRTKKWGAFIDVYGNLRANKPSCRLIKPFSDEYEKYTK